MIRLLAVSVILAATGMAHAEYDPNCDPNLQSRIEQFLPQTIVPEPSVPGPNDPVTCTAINSNYRRFKVTAASRKNPCAMALNTCRKQSKAPASCRYTRFSDIFHR